ncbi:DeoR/GlpR family DNA-binding transcription regulator [Cellulomonas sp. URHE0023]|uniref:DeoR/GlpR family DNA-binding transcription regulator n=1 Tax=Cellulomonas sp. URHE0023 TaxID=1380354 RepID=UPI0004807AFE|nr:DeoR/GlpR family DNA-binding transcription regulator [Cellulomonas sp. URHE0023]
MLAAERREFLLERLARDGKLVARELAAELGLSEDSVRRDLRELSAAGLAQRVYGGALPASPAVGDLTVRAGLSTAGKERIARAAVSLISPGMTVILDGGTTTLAVCAALPADLEATVITHSPTIASSLIPHRGVDVVVIGGRQFKHSGVAMGAAAAEAAAGISADLFLLGVTGVQADAGLTTGDSDEAAMKRLLAGRAAETWVLASSEKVGAASPFRVLPLTSVAGIVTDAGAESPAITALVERGVTVRYA